MILTRAARRKAGLSPPPSLFNGAPTIPLTTADGLTTSSADIDLSSSSSDDSGEGEEEEYSKPGKERRLWVQCEHSSCGKWRLVPKCTKIDTKSAWYCSMHPDPHLRSCAVPEEKWDDLKKRGYTFSKLNPGNLVWAKMRSFCPWPGILTPDPWSDNNYLAKEKEGCLYHVEFLGGRFRTHLWLTEDKVEPYYSGICSLGSVDVKNCNFKAAIEEADALLDLTDHDRLTTSQYTEESISGKRKVPIESKRRKRKKAKEGESCEKNCQNEVPDCSVSKCNECPESYHSSELAQLENLLQNSHCDIRDFIQTNFKIGCDGVIGLAASTTGGGAFKAGSNRKRGTGKKSTQNLPSSGTESDNPRKQKRTRQKAPCLGNRTSPVLPDYFSSATVISNKTVVAETPVPDHFQTVPTAEDDIACTEAVALREMEKIDDLLTMFGESTSDGMSTHSKCEGENNSEPSRVCLQTDDANSKWVESLLGEIDQIEGLIQDLSQGQVVPY